MQEETIHELSEEIQSMVAMFNLYSTCCNCTTCSALQIAISREVEKDIMLNDLEGKVLKQESIINYQHHHIATHWGLSVAEALKKVSMVKKDARLVEEVKKEVEKLKKMNDLVKEESR